MAPPGWHAIEPTGLARAILGVTLTFSILSIAVISLRIGVRLRLGRFATEDGLMCVGFVINMVHNSVICYGTFTGLGSPDSKIPGGTTGVIYMEGIKSIFLWQIFFLSGFVFIKCSICLTLLRIAFINWHKITLWILIAITIISTIVVDIYILIQCRPISRTWGESEGTCLPSTITVVITFVISGFNLVTDMTTAVLPFLMLKGLQMSQKRKTAITVVLSLGVLASIATIARLPFGKAYFATENYLVGIGHIILWTVVECDLALIAGSLPMLHALVKGLSQGSSNGGYVHSTELVTIGRKGYRLHNDAALTKNGAASESTQGIAVQSDRHILHEDPTLDRQDCEPPHHTRTYV
ncbi:hypothetical protein B0J13DRAFT_290189 [Dactylonectria estremocensis]|uniref:Rhodopsin domain-containing protein n=1 Tax=Dactylonectria estremocensis TaxID=1079267 RepID=A0A9P9F3L0_9HYPO|nr:hypothetical protein B0J13DRAFT_290189 [Dactylonectria estremocensis]